MRDIEAKLAHIQTLYPIGFTTDIHLYNLYWNVHEGSFPSAASHPPHTASIIEDIAFSGEILDDALTETFRVADGQATAIFLSRAEPSGTRLP